MKSSLHAALDAWRAHLGDHAVMVGADIPARLLLDTSPCRRELLAVLQIQSAGQLPELMRIARQHHCKVHPVSTARNWGYGSALPVADAVALIDMSRLQGIEFDSELGVVTIEPGVTQRMLAEKLAGHPYMVPTTGAGPNAGLLSNALERGYGITPHTDHFGALTDVEAVLADGNIYRSALREAGSEELARLFKWGIGPYVNGLFSQSGFGIVTRGTILLARRPETIKVCLFSLNDDLLLETAIERIRGILQTLPAIVGGLNLMNRHRVLAMTAPYPETSELGRDGLMTEQTVASLGRENKTQAWTGLATLYGTAGVVKAAQKEIRRRLRGVAHPLFLTSGQVAFLTRATRFVGAKRLSSKLAALHKAMPLFMGYPSEHVAMPLTYWRSRVPRPDVDLDPSRDGCGLLWYAPLVPMRALDVRRFIDFAHSTLVTCGLEPTVTLTSQGDRLFDCTIPLLFDLRDEQAAAKAHECLARLTEDGRKLGFYPYRLHVDAMAAHAERHAASSDLINRLRQAWDPDDSIAPGRYR
jgi:FAD/FMN-containing dehydrogenase